MNPELTNVGHGQISITAITQWIGLREILQENPIFNGKIYGFR
jgi:hypothetical protein